MNFSMRVIVAFAISLLGTQMSSGEARCQKLISFSKDYKVYDVSTKPQPAKARIRRLWTKWVVRPDALDRVRQDRGVSYKNYDHCVSLYEYDCSNDRIRVLSNTDFDSDGQVIKSWSSDSAAWDFAVPGSMGSEIELFACGTKTSPVEDPDIPGDVDSTLDSPEELRAGFDAVDLLGYEYFPDLMKRTDSSNEVSVIKYGFAGPFDWRELSSPRFSDRLRTLGVDLRKSYDWNRAKMIASGLVPVPQTQNPNLDNSMCTWPEVRRLAVHAKWFIAVFREQSSRIEIFLFRIHNELRIGYICGEPFPSTR